MSREVCQLGFLYLLIFLLLPSSLGQNLSKIGSRKEVIFKCQCLHTAGYHFLPQCLCRWILCAWLTSVSPLKHSLVSPLPESFPLLSFRGEAFGFIYLFIPCSYDRAKHILVSQFMLVELTEWVSIRKLTANWILVLIDGRKDVHIEETEREKERET